MILLQGDATAIGWNYLIQQAPIVVFMVIVCWFGFRYFDRQLKAYQKDYKLMVEKKDDMIALLNKESKEDLQKSFSVLQDVNGTLQQWIIKDDQNYELKKSISETMKNVQATSDKILDKLNQRPS